MRRLTLSNEQVMVYDDFLPPDAFDALLPYATNEQYAILHKEARKTDWRVGDGLPLLGTATTYFRPDASRYGEDETPRYPTGTPIDAFIDAIAEVAGETAAVLGDAGTAWDGLAVAPWIYRVGTRLSLHRDHNTCSGAFSFYIHRQWNFHWGGQLLIADPRTTGRPLSFWPSDHDEQRPGVDPGLALCVLPKPNRMVFLRADAYHMVTRVDLYAGDNPRVSLAGCFMRPKRSA